MHHNFDFKNLSLKTQSAIPAAKKPVRADSNHAKTDANDFRDKFDKYVKKNDQKEIRSKDDVNATAHKNRSDKTDKSEDIKSTETSSAANKEETSENIDTTTEQLDTLVTADGDNKVQLATINDTINPTNVETAEAEVEQLVSDIQASISTLEKTDTPIVTDETEELEVKFITTDEIFDPKAGNIEEDPEVSLKTLNKFIEDLEKLIDFMEKSPNPEQQSAIAQLNPKQLLAELKQFVADNGSGEQIITAFKQISTKVGEIVKMGFNANVEANADTQVDGLTNAQTLDLAQNKNADSKIADQAKVSASANNLGGQNLDLDQLPNDVQAKQANLTAKQLKELEAAAKSDTKPADMTKAEQTIQQNATNQPKQKTEQADIMQNKYADRYAKSTSNETGGDAVKNFEQSQSKPETAVKSYDLLQSSTHLAKSVAPKAMQAANSNMAGQDFLNHLAQNSSGNMPQGTDNNVAQVKLSMSQLKAGQSMPTNAMAFQVAKQISNGNQQFQIRLDPAELGRVNVKLSFKEGGNIKAHMVVERSDVFELMQRDARALEKALNEAGFDNEKVEIDLSLDQNANEQQSFKDAFNDNEQSASNNKPNEDQAENDGSMIAEQQTRNMPSHVTSVEIDRII